MKTSQDPYLDSGMKGFLLKTAQKEHWRVSSWYDFEDLLQDGYMCYAKCIDRYKNLSWKPRPSKSDRKWMMSLVRTTFYNYIYSLANRHALNHEIPVSQLFNDPDRTGDEPDFWEHFVPPRQEIVELGLVIERAPKEVQELLKLLATDYKDELKVQRTSLLRYRTPNGRKRVRIISQRRKMRESPNDRYCRFLGLDPLDYDVAGMVAEFHSEVESL